MADFKKYIPALKRWEGGFVNDPLDNGGATMAGVTLRTYTEYRKLKGLPLPTVQDLKKITEVEWQDIMKSLYWDKIMGDYILNQSVAELCCDWVINSGVGMIRRIQRALGVKQDGIFGKITLGAMNGYNQSELHAKIKSARLKFVHSIVANNPSQKRFLKGWVNRINSFRFSPSIPISAKW